jgi:predicted nicotinamide N-methyase
MSFAPAFDPVDFIRTQTTEASASIIPELKLHLATEVTPLWQLTEERLKGGNLPPPFWAFAWPGGQGVARYLLDHPEVARDKRVLDFASGSGIGAIAAMKAGAAQAVAIDIDHLALQAIQLNAALNNVAVETDDFIDMEKAPKRVDLIIAGDVCYSQAMSARIMRWLWLCVAAGIRVVIADPGRAYVPERGLTELATYTVPTSLDLEGEKSRTVRVWDVGLPEEES